VCSADRQNSVCDILCLCKCVLHRTVFVTSCVCANACCTEQCVWQSVSVQTRVAQNSVCVCVCDSLCLCKRVLHRTVCVTSCVCANVCYTEQCVWQSVASCFSLHVQFISSHNLCSMCRKVFRVNFNIFRRYCIYFQFCFGVRRELFQNMFLISNDKGILLNERVLIAA
jgi:hypothetical protein